MKNLEISSMLLMIKRGYNIYSLNNETIIQMLSLGLIELVNEELVITEIGDLYLNKIMDLSFSRETTLGRRLWSFSGTAYEIDSCSIDNYDTYKIIEGRY